MLSGCLTTPSIQLIEPKVDIPEVKLSPPADVVEGCDKLIKYDSTDIREVIKTTVKNHNLYFLCASKLDSAILFINVLQKNE